MKTNSRHVNIEMRRIKSLKLAPELEHRTGGFLAGEKNQALSDLVRDGLFAPVNDDHGPYHVYITAERSDLIMHIRNDRDENVENVRVAVAPYKRLIKDYFMLIASYRRAREAHMPKEKLEAIDMGRRGLHNEGAEMLKTRLHNAVELDDETARRLFTLMCALSMKSHSDILRG